MTDRFTNDFVAGGNGLDSINIKHTCRRGSLIGVIDGRGGGIGTFTVDGAVWRGCRGIERGDAADDVGSAGGAVPVGGVVVEKAEVGSAQYFNVVGEAGVGHTKVAGTNVGRMGKLVDEGSVGIVENLAVAVVLHHDHEDMVEMGDSFGNSSFLSGKGSREQSHREACCGNFLDKHVLHLLNVVDYLRCPASLHRSMVST